MKYSPKLSGDLRLSCNLKYDSDLNLDCDLKERDDLRSGVIQKKAVIQGNLWRKIGDDLKLDPDLALAGGMNQDVKLKEGCYANGKCGKKGGDRNEGYDLKKSC